MTELASGTFPDAGFAITGLLAVLSTDVGSGTFEWQSSRTASCHQIDIRAGDAPAFVLIEELRGCIVPRKKWPGNSHGGLGRILLPALELTHFCPCVFSTQSVERITSSSEKYDSTNSCNFSH